MKKEIFELIEIGSIGIIVNVEILKMEDIEKYTPMYDDLMSVIIPEEVIDSFSEKIDNINKKYEMSKRWRAGKYEIYYYIGADGEVWQTGEQSRNEDDIRYKLGNYFKTPNEAKNIINSKEWQEFKKTR